VFEELELLVLILLGVEGLELEVELVDGILLLLDVELLKLLSVEGLVLEVD